MAVNVADMKPFSFKMKIIIVLAGLALALQLLGVVTASWFKLHSDGSVAWFGFWQGCYLFDNHSERICLPYSNVSEFVGILCSGGNVDQPSNNSKVERNACLGVNTARYPLWGEDLYEVVRMLEIMGVIGTVLAMFITLMCLIYADFRQRSASILLLIVCFAAGIVIASGAILLIKSTDTLWAEAEARPSWSLDVSLLAAVVSILAGFLVIVDITEDKCISLYHEDIT